MDKEYCVCVHMCTIQTLTVTVITHICVYVRGPSSLHDTQDLSFSLSTMLHASFSSSKEGGQKKDLSFVCYCGNNSVKVVLCRQGFFHRGQSKRLFSLPSTKMQPFWYSN